MNESVYIRCLLLNQSKHPGRKELELEIMRLQNEINKIGVNINQIVKNNNFHMYRESDKIELNLLMDKFRDLLILYVSTIAHV